MTLTSDSIDLSSLPACWIALDCWTRDTDPIQNHPVAFRFDLSIPSEPQEGTLEIGASNKYLLWINGRLAAVGPLRANPEHRFLDSISLKKLLKNGINHFAVIVLPPTGVTGYSWVTRTGLFCRGQVTAGNTQVSFCSSPDWKACEARWVSSHGMLTSLPTGTQEHWNLQMEPPDWTINTPHDWRPVFLLGAAGTPPWTTLIPRPIPMLTHPELRHELVWTGRDDRLTGRYQDNLAVQFSMKKVERDRDHSDPNVPFTNAGSNVYTFDVGKTRLVTPRIDILESGEETRIEIYYNIALSERPYAMTGFDTQREGFCDSLQTAGRSQIWRTLQPRGCRFITVRVAGPNVCRFNISFEGTDYPFEQKVAFACENTEFSRYWDASKESLGSCSNDAMVDTCARENMLWTFDACVAGKAAYFSFGDASLWRHCLWLIAHGIDPQGIPSAVIPAQPSFMILFDQTMQWVVSCREYYLCTEDEDFLEDIFPAVARFLTKCSDHITNENLFVPPSFSWHWVDWAPLDRRAYSLPVNVALTHAYRAAAYLARCISEEAFENFARETASRLERAAERFFDSEARLYRDHIPPGIVIEPQNPFCPLPFDNTVSYSLHGNMRMAPLQRAPSKRAAIFEQVAGWLSDPEDPAVIFGPGWTQILLQPLVEARFVDETTTFLASKYGRQLATGSLTWTEDFNPSKHNTAHAWGAAVNSLIVEGYLGIRPVAPGWREISISPRVSWDFIYEIETCRGKVCVRQRSGSLFVRLPRDVIAHVGLETVSGNDSWQKTKYSHEPREVLAK